MDNKMKAIPSLTSAEYGKILHFLVFHCLLNTDNFEFKIQSTVPLTWVSTQIFKTKRSKINSFETSCLEADFKTSPYKPSNSLQIQYFHVHESVLQSSCLLYI